MSKFQEESLDFPSQKSYFISALILVNRKNEILLVKERDSDIWIPPGGEVDYQKKEQFGDCVLRETLEEVGITVQKKPELIDLTISYPEGDNPYKDEKISLVIATYVAKFPVGQEIKLNPSFDPKEREYDVKEYIWARPQEIINKQIKVPKYFIKRVIPKINSWLKQYVKE